VISHFILDVQRFFMIMHIYVFELGDVVSENWVRASAAGPATSFAYSSAAASAAVGCGTGESSPSDQSAVYRERTCKDTAGETADTATAGDIGTEGQHNEAAFLL